MKTALFSIALLSATAVAEARPSTYNMSCSAARNLVSRRGAVVMNYAYSDRAGHLYQRFVAHRGYCDWDEAARGAWVRTRDRASCFIGYTCQPGGRD